MMYHMLININYLYYLIHITILLNPFKYLFITSANKYDYIRMSTYILYILYAYIFLGI